MIRHLVNMLLALLPPSRLFAVRRALLRLAAVEVEDGVSFCGGGWIYGRGRLQVGADTWLSPGAVVYTHVEAPIRIGSRCDVGPEVSFVTGSHELGSPARRAGPGLAQPITIGDGCWIGARSLILGGVTIGPGCVVAAGAVVTKSWPANTLLAGVPAAPKRQLPA